MSVLHGSTRTSVYMHAWNASKCTLNIAECAIGKSRKEWAVMDSNHRRRTPAELQSAPFGHSGNCPLLGNKGKVFI